MTVKFVKLSDREICLEILERLFRRIHILVREAGNAESFVLRIGELYGEFHRDPEKFIVELEAEE